MDASPTDASAGFESPAPTGESFDDRTDSLDTLEAIITGHEDVDWSDVPGISAAEAAAWTQRLIQARDRFEEGL
jgi:hypothetical protein